MLGKSSGFSASLKYGFRSIIRQKANANPLFLLALLLLVAVNAVAQFKSGTVVIIGYSHNKIIIAADSRQTEENGTYHDAGCKIMALNDKFFFSAAGRTGDITNGIIGWSAPDQARKLSLPFRGSRAPLKIWPNTGGDS